MPGNILSQLPATESLFARFAQPVSRVSEAGRAWRGYEEAVLAPGLAPAADLHLRLHHHRHAQLLGRGYRFLHGARHPAGRSGHTMRDEEFLRLVLVQIHVVSLTGAVGRPLARREPGMRAPETVAVTLATVSGRSARWR